MMYQNYFERVVNCVIDALRVANLPVRVRVNGDHSIALHLFEQSVVIRHNDDEGVLRHSRLYLSCETPEERYALRIVFLGIVNTLWAVPKTYWCEFKQIADRMLA